MFSALSNKVVIAVFCLTSTLVAFIGLKNGIFSKSSADYTSYPLNLQRRRLLANITLQKGQQPIATGCANFYGSNYQKHPETEALVVCDDQAGTSHAEVDYDTIKANGLSPQDSNHGVSFIETGKETWVTLFMGHRFNGMSYVIPPFSSVWLETIQVIIE